MANENANASTGRSQVSAVRSWSTVSERPRAPIARALSALALALAFVGCAALPELQPRGPSGYALAPQPGGPLAAVEASLAQRAGPDQSGFSLLDSNEDGLRWRLALVDSAEHSLDLQY